MILAGEQSTFPKLLFIANRMKIERLIEEGLLHAGSGKADMDRIHRATSNHMHGQAMRTSAETETEDESDSRMLSEARRSSMLQEIQRQVFLNDGGHEDEDTGESEDDPLVADHGEHRKVVGTRENGS